MYAMYLWRKRDTKTCTGCLAKTFPFIIRCIRWMCVRGLQAKGRPVYRICSHVLYPKRRVSIYVREISKYLLRSFIKNIASFEMF